MKRIIALAFPFLVLAGAAIILVALEARRTPDWESELNSYIARSKSPELIANLDTIGCALGVK